MANEKLQRYFTSIVKIISDACTKEVKKELCRRDEQNFNIFYKKFNQFSETECPTLYNLVQLFYLIEDLKKIIKAATGLESFFSQQFSNAQIFFNIIFDATSLTKTYVEALKKLYLIEEMNIELLVSLGPKFRKTLIEFQNLHTPTWNLLEQFKDNLKKHNTSPTLNARFDPIIALIEREQPMQINTTPTFTLIAKASVTSAQ